MGHLLAIVTGKLALVYSVFDLSYAKSAAGCPREVMWMVDHSHAITDLVFSADDHTIYTCSVDGAVYEWSVGCCTRKAEYVFKGSCVSRILVAGRQIVAVVDNSLPGYHVSHSAAHSGAADRTSHNHNHNHNHNRVRVPDSQQSEPQQESVQTSFLATWEGQHVIEEVTSVLCDFRITSIASFYSRDSEQDALVIGTADGRVIISLLPFPLQALSLAASLLHHIGTTDCRPGSPSRPTTHQSTESKESKENSKPSTPQTTATSSTRTGSVSGADGVSRVGADIGIACPAEVQGTDCVTDGTGLASSPPAAFAGSLKVSGCRVFSNHNGPVSSLCVSRSGLWVITGGDDGAMFILGTSARYNLTTEIPECQAIECKVTMINREFAREQSSRIVDMERWAADETVARERIMAVERLTFSSEIQKLQAALKREVSKRDNIILNERTEAIKRTKDLHAEIENVKITSASKTKSLEFSYEMKLAQESSYLDKLRQAYDEFIGTLSYYLTIEFYTVLFNYFIFMWLFIQNT